MCSWTHECKLADVLTAEEQIVLGEVLETALGEASDVLEQTRREAPAVAGSTADVAETYLALIASQEVRIGVLQRIQQLLLH